LNQNECQKGSSCKYNSTLLGFFCTPPYGLNQPCRWDTNGLSNCTDPTVCVCFGETSGRCVDKTSPEYLSKFSEVNNGGSFLDALTATVIPAAVCLNQAGLNLDESLTIPSDLQLSYLKYKLPDCPSLNFGSLSFEAIQSTPGCRQQYAKLLCCILCSFEDLYESFGFPKNDPIFAATFPFFGPQFKLRCGKDPDFDALDEDSCSSTQLFSWNDLTNLLQCSLVYYEVSFIIKGLPSTVLAKDIISQYLTDQNISPPITIAVSSDGVVTLVYTSSTDAAKAESSINSGFNAYISSTVAGAYSTSASTVTRGISSTTSSASSLYNYFFIFVLLLTFLLLK